MGANQKIIVKIPGVALLNWANRHVADINCESGMEAVKEYEIVMERTANDSTFSVSPSLRPLAPSGVTTFFLRAGLLESLGFRTAPSIEPCLQALPRT